MLLDEINISWLEAFAGSTIYNRGVGYCETGHVYRLELDDAGNEITARVSGNYGNYEVTIKGEREPLDADCDCPYDGYPCKHIVAVCLQYMKNKGRYRSAARKRSEVYQQIELELLNRSTPELTELLMKAVHHSTELQSIVMLHLFPEAPETEEALLSRVDDIDLEDFYDDFRSDAEKAREIKELLREVADLPHRVKVVVSWKIADKILHFLNQYGIADERWEGIVLDILEEIVPILKEDDTLIKLKKEVRSGLVAHYEWENCGLIDAIGHYVEELL